MANSKGSFNNAKLEKLLNILIYFREQSNRGIEITESYCLDYLASDLFCASHIKVKVLTSRFYSILSNRHPRVFYFKQIRPNSAEFSNFFGFSHSFSRSRRRQRRRRRYSVMRKVHSSTRICHHGPCRDATTFALMGSATRCEFCVVRISHRSTVDARTLTGVDVHGTAAIKFSSYNYITGAIKSTLTWPAERHLPVDPHAGRTYNYGISDAVFGYMHTCERHCIVLSKSESGFDLL